MAQRALREFIAGFFEEAFNLSAAVKAHAFQPSRAIILLVQLRLASIAVARPDVGGESLAEGAFELKVL